jgi:predicted permease
MLGEILNIIAPVFIVVGAGYLAVRLGLFGIEAIDHLMKFATTFAIPCLLFLATSTIDLGAAFDWRVLTAYYGASISGFVLTYLVARKLFKRRPGEAVAVGFAALFSNLVLIGLPIAERAWEPSALAPNFALVSVNAPVCYLVGITAMELLRADGRNAIATTGVVLNAMFRNSMMIGIVLGFAVNLSGLPLPAVLLSAIDLMARASLPVALFALGGVLTRYTLKHSLGEAGTVSVISLVLQPALTLLIATQLELPRQTTHQVVLMAAAAPGLNAYLFASMYNRALGASASSVLLSTLLSVFTMSAWLVIL